MKISSNLIDSTVSKVVKTLPGISSLYQSQQTLLEALLSSENIFFTSATNSGKTLPPLIYPYVLKELAHFGCEAPENPRILFVTALNSLQLSVRSGPLFIPHSMLLLKYFICIHFMISFMLDFTTGEMNFVNKEMKTITNKGLDLQKTDCVVKF